MALVLTRDARIGIESVRTAMTLLEEDEGLRHDTDLLPWVVLVPLFLRESGAARSLVDEAIDTARARAASAFCRGCSIAYRAITQQPTSGVAQRWNTTRR